MYESLVVFYYCRFLFAEFGFFFSLFFSWIASQASASTEENDENATTSDQEKAAMKDRLRALAATFGSASDEELDIRFNPDIFTP